MTMPHLMNCQHSCEGWCIPCVKEMHEEAERLQQWKAKAIDVIAQWESIWEALGQHGQIGSSKAAEAKKEVERLRARVTEWERRNQEGDSDNGDGSPTGKLVMVLPIRYAIEFHVYNGVAGSEGAIGIRDDRNRFWPIAGMTCSQPATLPDGSVNEMNCRLLLRDSAVMLGKVAREIEGRIQTKWDDAKFFSPKVDA